MWLLLCWRFLWGRFLRGGSCGCGESNRQAAADRDGRFDRNNFLRRRLGSRTREEIGGHRADVTSGFVFGVDLMLGKLRLHIPGEPCFNMLEVLYLLSDEIGDAAMLVECFAGHTGYENRFHRKSPKLFFECRAVSVCAHRRLIDVSQECVGSNFAGRARVVFADEEIGKSAGDRCVLEDFVDDSARCDPW